MILFILKKNRWLLYGKWLVQDKVDLLAVHYGRPGER